MEFTISSEASISRFSLMTIRAFYLSPPQMGGFAFQKELGFKGVFYTYFLTLEMGVCHGACMEVRRQLVGNGFSSPAESKELDSSGLVVGAFPC